MHRHRLLLPLLATTLWSPLAAQRLTVRLVEGDSLGRAAGAIVTLLRGDEELSRHLANGVGVTAFPLPGPGVYRIRVDRIGRATFLSDTVMVRRTDRTLQLRLHSTPFTLPEVTALAPALCEQTKSGAEVLRLWEEARKALLTTSLSRDEGGSYEQQLFTRELSLVGSILTTSSTTQISSAARPFLTYDPDSLEVVGYVRRNQMGGFAFVGPDERVLLSESFLASHCIGLRRAPGESPGRVGLWFEPTERRNISDISGTLWFEEQNGYLHEVVFTYTNLPREVDFAGVGGRIVFEQKTSGAWFVHAWSIRTPIVVRGGLGPPASTLRRWLVTGYREEGGTARPLP